MKTITILGIFLISALNADWQRVVGISDEPVPPQKTTIMSDSLGVCIQTVIYGFTEHDTVIDAKDFKRIRIPEEPVLSDTMSAGKPEIPFVRLLIAIPDSASLETKLYNSDHTEYDNYLIYPIPRVVFEDSGGCVCFKEIYTYDTTFFDKDTLYPGVLYELGTDGYWREQRVLEVFLYPIQFNPQQNRMYLHHELDLRIDFSGTVIENTMGLGPFEEIGREVLLNYQGIDREAESVPEPAFHYYSDLRDTNNVADYLIVMGTDFYYNETASYWLEQFAQWRVDHNGFEVGLVKMDDIYTQFDSLAPDSAAQLRHFLAYAYDHWQAPSMSDDHFAYCLFVGDWDYVPTRLVEKTWMPGWVPPRTYLVAQDGFFRDLSSPYDTFEEIMLGRWPVKDTAITDLVTVAQKTIDYENSPILGGWRRAGLLIAGGGENHNVFDTLVTTSTDYLKDIGYDTSTVRWMEIQNVAAFIESIDTYLNLGSLVTIYYDHGAPDGWWYYDTSHVKNLNNGTRLPVVFSHACLTAMFQWDHPYYDATLPPRTSFGEHFLANPNGGAIAFYGATCPAGSDFLVLGIDIICRIFRWQNWTLGKALVNLPLVTFHPGNPSENSDFCLLGDPALDLGDYSAYPNLPDLVVRPRGIDITLESPYPYPTTNDIIPISAKVFNIGATTAYNVDVYFEVMAGSEPMYANTVSIPEIGPRDTTIVIDYWDTGVVYPDSIGDLGNLGFLVKVDPDNEIPESWEQNNEANTPKRVVLYPPGWSKEIPQLCGQLEKVPALANLDESGTIEVVFAGLDSVYVFNANGTHYGDWPEYFRDVYGVLLADIDANGWIDIIAISEDTLKAYFNSSGSIAFAWAEPVLANYKFTGLPAAGHIQESGMLDAPDIAVLARPTDSDGYLKIAVYEYGGGSPIYVWESSTIVPFEQTQYGGPSLENLIPSGGDEMVIAYRNPNYPFVSRTDVFNDQPPHLQISLDNYGRNQIVPALADINNDNNPDLLTCTHAGVLLAYDALASDTIWKTTALAGAIMNSPGVGNISERHPDDLEIPYAVSAKMRLVRGADGTDHEGWPYELGEQAQTSPALARLEGKADVYADIAFGSTNGLHAVNYLKDTTGTPLPMFGLPNSSVIGDIDGDRKSETAMYSDDGYLHVWENTMSSVIPYELEWPQFQHDHQRTGLYGWVSGLRGGKANPKEFSTGTTLSFSLLDTLHTRVTVYDSDGNQVRILVNQILPQGTYHPVWHGNDHNFSLLPDGVYFIKIKVGNDAKIIPVIINR